MVNAISLLGVLFFLLAGLVAIFGGVYQLYHVVTGSEAQLAVGGRFRFLFGFGDPTSAERRLFWSVGGIALLLGGVTFLGLVAFALRSGLLE